MYCNPQVSRAEASAIGVSREAVPSLTAIIEKVVSRSERLKFKLADQIHHQAYRLGEDVFRAQQEILDELIHGRTIPEIAQTRANKVESIDTQLSKLIDSLGANAEWGFSIAEIKLGISSLHHNSRFGHDAASITQADLEKIRSVGIASLFYEILSEGRGNPLPEFRKFDDDLVAFKRFILDGETAQDIGAALSKPTPTIGSNIKFRRLGLASWLEVYGVPKDVSLFTFGVMRTLIPNSDIALETKLKAVSCWAEGANAIYNKYGTIIPIEIAWRIMKEGGDGCTILPAAAEVLKQYYADGKPAPQLGPHFDRTANRMSMNVGVDSLAASVGVSKNVMRAVFEKKRSEVVHELCDDWLGKFKKFCDSPTKSGFLALGQISLEGQDFHPESPEQIFFRGFPVFVDRMPLVVIKPEIHDIGFVLSVTTSKGSTKWVLPELFLEEISAKGLAPRDKHFRIRFDEVAYNMLWHSALCSGQPVRIERAQETLPVQRTGKLLYISPLTSVTIEGEVTHLVPTRDLGRVRLPIPVYANEGESVQAIPKRLPLLRNITSVAIYDHTKNPIDIVRIERDEKGFVIKPSFNQFERQLSGATDEENIRGRVVDILDSDPQMFLAWVNAVTESQAALTSIEASGLMSIILDHDDSRDTFLTHFGSNLRPFYQLLSAASLYHGQVEKELARRGTATRIFEGPLLMKHGSMAVFGAALSDASLVDELAFAQERESFFSRSFAVEVNSGESSTHTIFAGTNSLLKAHLVENGYLREDVDPICKALCIFDSKLVLSGLNAIQSDNGQALSSRAKVGWELLVNMKVWNSRWLRTSLQSMGGTSKQAERFVSEQGAFLGI